MIYYYTIAAILSIFSFYEQFVKDKKTVYISIIFSAIYLALFAGLRVGVGPDQASYVEIFNAVPNIFDISEYNSLFSIHGEYGYLFINMIVKIFSDNPSFIFVLVAFFAVLLNINSYLLYSNNTLLCIFIYFVHGFMYREMIQIRQGVASAIVLFAVRYIVDRKFAKYFIAILLATSFHFGAIIALIAYFIYKPQVKKKSLYLLLIIAILTSEIHFIMPMLVFLSAFNVLPSQLTTYIGWDLYNYSLGGLKNPTTFKQVLICLICFYYYKNLVSTSQYFKPMLYMYLMSTVWLLVFNDFAILAGRTGSYLSVCEPILVSNFMFINKSYNHIILLLIILAYTVILYLNLSVKGLLLPYQSLIGL